MVHKLTSTQNRICWVAQLIAALIMLQTLFFKFTGADESVYIFTKIGLEPWGRYGTGIVELIASIFILIPSVCWIGAVLGAGTMAGALFTHITILGISVKGDGGYLFFLAIVTLLACTTILFLRKHQIPYINKYFSHLA